MTPFSFSDPAEIEAPVDETLLRAASRFRVELRDCPPLDIDADSPEAAVVDYKRQNGILATVNKFSVLPL
jgi:hypothetical protein